MYRFDEAHSIRDRYTLSTHSSYSALVGFSENTGSGTTQSVSSAFGTGTLTSFTVGVLLLQALVLANDKIRQRTVSPRLVRAVSFSSGLHRPAKPVAFPSEVLNFINVRFRRSIENLTLLPQLLHLRQIRIRDGQGRSRASQFRKQPPVGRD